MDAAVLACPFPRPSLVVKYNQLYSEMRNVRACFYDVTTRMLCFFCTARQLSSDLESPEISRTQENPRSHIFVFVVTAFSVVACALTHACSFVSHPSLRTAQGGIILLDVVSEKHSILPRSVFVLHGHRFCRAIAVVLIASIEIWIPDMLLYFYRETGNRRFTGSVIRAYRVIDSGATVQSVSRCLLVVKKAILLFHDGMKKLQRWNHLISE